MTDFSDASNKEPRRAPVASARESRRHWRDTAMPDPEQPQNVDVRILEELTFIADHLISVERLLKEILHRMDGQTMGRDVLRIP